MKKVFENPEMEVVSVEQTDVVCTSGCPGCLAYDPSHSVTEPV